jgi:hypothetical protein
MVSRCCSNVDCCHFLQRQTGFVRGVRWEKRRVLRTRRPAKVRCPSARTHPPPARSTCSTSNKNIRGRSSLLANMRRGSRRSPEVSHAGAVLIDVAWGLTAQGVSWNYSRGAVHHLADGGVLIDGRQELLRLLVLCFQTTSRSMSAPPHLKVWRLTVWMRSGAL